MRRPSSLEAGPAVLGPCSPIQERLWFLDQLAPHSGPAYNLCTATRLRGELERGALDTALAWLCRRHESLRTTFVQQGDRPQRRVAPGATLSMEVQRVREEELQATIEQVASTRFDLTNGPLARVVLLEVGARDAVLVLSMSHTIADGWSVGILHRELGLLYEAALAGKPAPLSELESDFGAWILESQRQAKAGFERAAAFWREELSGAPTILELPTDRKRPASERYAGGTAFFGIPSELAEKVRSVARELNVTPFAIYLAAYALVLARWSGQRELVVGTPWANRRTLEQEALVGPLMEMLLIRVAVDPGETVESLVKSVRRRLIRAMSHAELGFDQIVSVVRPARETSRNPLFQAMFTLQNTPAAPLALAGCTAEPLEIARPTARLDLALDLIEAGGETTARWEYNSDLFDAATLERVRGRYLHFLREMTARPSAELGSLEPLDDAERQLVLRKWNGQPAQFEGPWLIHALVDKAALSVPEGLALESDEGRLTYRELRQRSIAAAEGLLAHGVKPGEVVGVCLDRSLEMVVALLAVMRCGAAYLPLDPGYPDQRLTDMLQDADASLVLVGGSAVGRSFAGRPVVSAADLPVVETPGQSLPEVRPEDVAYVIFTSGSTGRPKGVMVSHRSATHFMQWAQQSRPLTPDDRLLGKTPFTFDISVWEMFGTLIAGATLVLTAPGRHRDASHVAELLADARITVTHFVPSMLRGVLSLPRLPPWPRLRCVFAGGEALPADIYEQFARHSAAPVLNFYGPTETAIYVSCHTAGDRVSANGTIPIGYPVANTAFYVLDDELRPVPMGAPGELYIGGVQVAEGYLHRPGLTATRFLPDPFSKTPGSRMYRTGDRVRRASDGSIDFLGRFDGQVKLRGFRIELGEIESALRQHPRVANAAVEVRSAAGAESLVAHAVPAAGAPPEKQELRAFLEGRLPDYMVPSRFRFCEQLPLTTSGKLDRKALAELPVADGEAAQDGPSSPMSPVEALLSTIWSDIIGSAVTDLHANFFELGGDSITAVAVVTECDRRGLEVAVQEVFEHPTIASLAKVARLRPLGERAAPRRLPLAAWQRVLLRESPSERLHLARLGLKRFLGEAPLASAMRRLEQQHGALRLEVTAGATEATLAESSIHRTRRRGALPSDTGPGRITHEAEARAWLAQTVDVTQGRPWGAVLLDAPAGGTPTLMLAVDSAICDSGSLGAIIREFARLLDAGPEDVDRSQRASNGDLAVNVPGGMDALSVLSVGAEAADVSAAWAHWAEAPVCKTRLADLACTAVMLAMEPRASAELMVQQPLELAEALRLHRPPEGTPLPGVFRAVRQGLRAGSFAPIPANTQAEHVLVRVAELPGGVPAGSLTVEDVLLARATVLPTGVKTVIDVVLRAGALSVRCRGAAMGEAELQRLCDSVLAESRRVRDAVLAGGTASYLREDFPLAKLMEGDLSLLTQRFPDLEDVVPLGPMQQHVLERLQQVQLDGLYVVCFTAAMDNEGFDVDAWLDTWRALMSRHPGLRTSFLLDTSIGPVQLVHRRLELPCEVVDLRHLGLDAARAEVLRQEALFRAHHIRLTDAPQWTMRIFRIGDDQYRVICRLVYSLQDGWSVSVLQNEWYPLYDALRARKAPELPAPGAPYSTHIRALAQRELPPSIEYWRQQLAGAEFTRVVEKTLRERSRPGEGLEHQTCSAVLTRAEEQAIRAFARREHLTLFTPLQAAWALLIAGLTGRDRVLFGTISSGRAAPDIRRTYGSFNNMMPTPVQLRAADRVETFLLELQGRQLEARAHDLVPLPALNRVLGLPAGTDLLDTYIVHENFPIDRDVQTRFQRWKPDIAEMRTEHALRMLIWPVGELSFHLSFDARLMCQEDAQRLLKQYLWLLKALSDRTHPHLGGLIHDPFSIPG